MGQSPKLFSCPKCRHRYLGHDPLPDCPHCGYDYREKEGFRWDVLVYLMSMLALVSFLLVASYYRENLETGTTIDGDSPSRVGERPEKLPGSGTSRARRFESPYHEPRR